LVVNFDTYAVAAFFVKLSLFLLYLRLFKADKVTRWLIYGGILASGVIYSVCVIIYTAVVVPSPGQPDSGKIWASRVIKNQVLLRILSAILGAFGALSDIYLLVIPIRAIFHLQLPIRRKFGVSSIFLIGIL
jgi:hypothetical protein